MNKFKLTLNKSLAANEAKDEKPNIDGQHVANEATDGKMNKDGQHVANEEKLKENLPIKKKRSLMDVKKKKIATVKGYCTQENKALFAAYCRQNDISESSYIEKSIQKAIKSLQAKEKG